MSGGQDRIVRLHNPHTGLLVKVYKGHGYDIFSLDMYVRYLFRGNDCRAARTTILGLRLQARIKQCTCGMFLRRRLHDDFGVIVLYDDLFGPF